MKGYVKKMISEYPCMVREREHLQKRIENCKFLSVDELISAMSFSHPDGERVQSSAISDKTARIAICYQQELDRINDEMIETMQKRYDALDEEITFFEESVHRLPGELSQPMSALFLEGYTWDEVEIRFCMSRKTISNYRNEAIEYLVRIYQRRSSLVEAVLLS
jgi:CRP-like cAMP-binding protein